MPRPNPAGTAPLRLRNRPARAANHAYSATSTCTATNGRYVGLRNELVSDVSTPVVTPTTGPASAVARIVPVVSRKSGRLTASTAADRVRLMATATGIRASRRIDTRGPWGDGLRDASSAGSNSVAAMHYLTATVLPSGNG